MKRIEVVAAVIQKGDLYLATQRGYGEFQGKWEFPGGKIQEGETHQEALVREIQEELGARILVERFLITTEYDYGSFYLVMHSYLCSLVPGETVELLEHEALSWCLKNDLMTIDWLPADVDVVHKLLS